MVEEEGQFSGGGGLTLRYRVWRPPGAPVGAVVLCHGLGEHAGRYRHVASGLTDAGYTTWALDHRGHGRSEGTRVFVERFGTFVADLETFRLLTHTDAPDLPQFLLGHSMGGAIALAHAVERPGGFAGVVLSAPAVQAGASVSAALRLAGKVVTRVAPKAGVVALDATTISRDPAVVAAYRNDPLVHQGKVTARLGAELMARGERFPAEVGRLVVPMLVVHGTADRLVPIAGTHTLFPLIGSADKTLKVYDGLYHEVLNEPEGPAVLADIIAWLDDHRSVAR